MDTTRLFIAVLFWVAKVENYLIVPPSGSVPIAGLRSFTNCVRCVGASAMCLQLTFRGRVQLWWTGLIQGNRCLVSLVISLCLAQAWGRQEVPNVEEE